MEHERRHGIKVVHFGMYGEVPGGIAQLVNALVNINYGRCQVTAVALVKRPRDPMAPLRLVRGLFEVVRVATARPAVIHVHLSQRGSFVREGAIVVMASLLRVPVVAQIHGSGFDSFALQWSSLTRHVLRRPDVVVVLTENTERIVSDLIGNESGTEVVRLGNAVDIPGVIAAKTESIVFAGAVGARKGADTLVEAWQLVQDKRNWRLLIAGPLDPDAPDLQGVPQLDYLGVLAHESLTTLLEQASISVLPSRGEALPMFLLESMARGATCVGTTVGSVPMLLDGVGIVVPPGDARELANALQTLIGDGERRTTLGLRARAKVAESYSIGELARAMEEMWLRLAGEQSESP